jgi:hypothetical protein
MANKALLEHRQKVLPAELEIIKVILTNMAWRKPIDGGP